MLGLSKQSAIDISAADRSLKAGKSTVGAADVTKSGPAGARTATVLSSLAVAFLVLLPGLMLKLDIRTGSASADGLLDHLGLSLADIRFGRGLRFWLGVTGATMMALLLLYPLRKALSKSRWFGKVAGWFQFHILFGIFGPVLVLYHANFGTGSANANVALWTMLAVAVSGLAGHFVYASVSAGFYANKHRAQEQLAAIGATLRRIDALVEVREAVLQELMSFDAGLLTPRRGIVASLVARVKLERRRARIARAIGLYIAHATAQLGLDDARHDQLRRTIAGHYGTYMRIARAASGRSIREQIWARWRLFHLPLFLIMIVAGGLHVVAVWDLDAPSQKAAAPVGPITEDSPVQVAERPSPQPGVGLPIAAPVPVVLSKPTHFPETAPAFDREPTLVGAPKRAARPSAVMRAPADVPSQRVENAGAVAGADDSAALYAELERRTGEAPMALGGVKARPLAEQIALFKARQQAGTFAHSDAQTGFALIGKHTSVACATCHIKPLRETRQPEPRACIACHKDDDVHRGRRTDCAQCHTPTRWSDVKRRK